jgi:murein DD-endopeptidase MepM/ murein hydrolase activator NlpD
LRQQKRLQEIQRISEKATTILSKPLSLSDKRRQLQLLLNQQNIPLPAQLKQTLECQIEHLVEQARSMDGLIAELDREVSRIIPKMSPKTLSLQLPAEGKILTIFGKPIPGTGKLSKGILIETSLNTRIVAPASGHVVFSGPFKKYGKIVILDHSNGFHSLVAGLSVVKVGLGEEIQQGGYLGHMAPQAALLTFELRKEGKPVDPKEFLSGR